MRILAVIIIVLLLLGPLRRPFLNHARVAIPGLAGLILGCCIGLYVGQRAGLSGTYTFILAITIGISLSSGFVETTREWCHRNLNNGDKNHGRH
jgi:hypothetical protein